MLITSISGSVLGFLMLVGVLLIAAIGFAGVTADDFIPDLAESRSLLILSF